MTITRKAKLTKTLVDRLQPGELVADTELSGFWVRCQFKAKVFVVFYRINGRQRWYSIGRYGVLTVEQARQEARAILGMVASGKDPAATKETNRKAPTVQECVEAFMASHGQSRLKPASRDFYQGIFDRVILPKLGMHKMQALSRQDVAKLHDRMGDKPTTANRVLAVLSALCNWAEKRGYRSDNSNPCRMIDKYKETARTRFLSDTELTRLAEALKQAERGAEDLAARQDAAHKAGKRLALTERPDLQASPMAVAAIRLLLFTGARLSEILTLKWDHVDFERTALRLPDSKTGAKTILLNGPALALLQSLPRMQGNPYVIFGDKEGQHLIGLQKIWERIRAAAGLDDLRLHDLRHSYASTAVAAGYSLHITGKLLGQTQAATTHRYAHLADDPLRKATEAVGSRISAVMAASPGGGGNVVELAGKKHR
jgi:integrase